MSGRVRSLIRVEGVVQGVGFRPFVHALASRYGLAGLVGNDGGGVFIEAEGPPSAVAALVEAVRERAPVLAVVERVSVTAVPPTGDGGFRIVPSVAGGPGRALVPPDVATCDDCLAELFDPADRRFRYPFVNCVNCGPRFTIITAVPYDRAVTTMAGFALCAACAREYHDPADRRFHAQPTCCPACGPRLALRAPDGTPLPGDPLTEAAALVAAGAVVAVKGLGGYHLAADAASEDAVAALRARKRRPDKAFAVMAADLAAARELCEVGEAAAALLTGPARPIVLLPRRAGAPVAPSVAPGGPDLGVLLPYTPLHHLLCRELARPYVLTSGNLADEPIAHDDEDALRRLGGVADAFLCHDRPIHAPADDSVLRVFRGTPAPVRRSRGYAPEAITLPWPFRRPVLACGAEQKSTFCLGQGHRAVLSQHLGDLEGHLALRAYTGEIERMRRLLGVEPEVVAYDPHPEYLSTKYALELDGVDVVAVQHHHAHIASCLADNGEAGPVVGVAFDGTGHGPDGTIWGGELLVASLSGYERAGHLERVPLPGGVSAIRQPWRMAAAYVGAAGLAAAGEPAGRLAVARRNARLWPAVSALAAAGGPAAPLTSSAGRLFDAVAALLGVRDAVTYEGQAAMGLEHLADPAVRDGYPVTVTGGAGSRLAGGRCATGSPGLVKDGHGATCALAAPVVIRSTDLVRAVVEDLRRGVPSPVIAARFHHGLAEAVVTAAGLIAEAAGIGTVALSGGVFANELLLGGVADGLRAGGFRVLTHRRVPCNDGGISLGQAAVAASL
ncbi:carbamoyltransferase HypF [Nonomuraea roseoviolacea subsp. roseoviolacea]|uniref:Carbamoyltransferase n=1 Tax=Nonomuraea roseoviolacea subsp. carminata TaxID=160689 RepID=A0ABT1KAY0_9ACTN|nr:carbamoyltransferase HypF [Nonomuraea roseoviolacea]MCP2351179.1 hydrogenase maturation protein HypF [Nonomuraea roseoviolacea subsp. carminata]